MHISPYKLFNLIQCATGAYTSVKYAGRACDPPLYKIDFFKEHRPQRANQVINYYIMKGGQGQ